MKPVKPEGKPDIDNLYNCSHHKTRKVREYLKTLDYNPKWDIIQKAKFDQELREALNAPSATAALDKIGYQYKGMPNIYSRITNSTSQYKMEE